jgi:hypothetical protein
MSNAFHFGRSTTQRALRGIVAATQLLSAVAGAVVGSGALGARPAFAAGNISGTVFQDFNANGTQDTAIAGAVDQGVSGIVVTAFDAGGQTVGTATTDGLGAYSIAASGTGPYRIEFTNLPNGFSPSAHAVGSYGANASGRAGSTVQFVNDGDTAHVNLGINAPGEYCQNNPQLATCNLWQGDAITGANNDEPVLRQFPYSAGAAASSITPASYDTPATAPNTLVAQLGSAHSLGYDRVNRRIYVAAYYKRHAGFGPQGAGAIYRVNASTGAVEGSFVVPDVLPIGVTNLHDTTDYLTYASSASFDRPGKVSLGGLALSDDGTRLYVMNLTNRTLYAFTPQNGTLLTSAAVPVNGIGTDSGSQCSSDDIRPFAVEFHRNNLYVGAVCSGQSSGSRDDLYAYVWRVDPATLTFSATPILAVPLDYGRGDVDNPTVNNKPAEWNAWLSVYPASLQFENAPGYPQPMLTAIQFDRNGDMLLGLRDRLGDQMGNQMPSAAPTFSGDRIGITAGDLLRACALNADGGGNTIQWALESNGSCGNGTGSGPTPANAPAPNNGVLEAQGPGSGEYYGGDGWYPAGDEHDEVLTGGVLQVPGYSDVVAASFNPIPGTAGSEPFDNGIRWLSNATGAQTRAYRLVDGNWADGRTFAKANGIGELIALCDIAPIEIGNRVWNDSNGNGVQDAAERGIDGVRVELFALGQSGAFDVLVGTALTAQDGEYYFIGGSEEDDTNDNAGIVSGGVLPNTAYRIVVTPPVGVILTPNDIASGANADAIDSDAVQLGTSAAITLTTGGPGANDHTLDTGFTSVYAVGNRTWIDANNNGIQDDGEPGVSTTVRLFRAGPGDLLTQVGTDIQSDATGYYCFDSLPAGNYVIEAVTPPGHASSTPDAADPNADADDRDDNGTFPSANGGVRSGVVTIGPGASEPLSEPDAGPAGSGCTGSTLADAYKNETVDFGFFPALTLGNLIFLDVNNNGIRDSGEAGVDGVPVTLYPDANNDGAPDGAAITSTLTAGGGLYLFTGLQPGTYIVEITPPPGYSSSTGGNSEPAPDPDTTPETDNDDNGSTAGDVIRSAPITLTPGGEPTGENPADPTVGVTDGNGNMTVDFGLQLPVLTYALGNRVWFDVDNSGSINDADGATPGLDAVTVRLYAIDANGQPGGNALQTTSTANGGYYCFANLGAADYLVEVVIPNGMSSSVPESADPNTDVDSDDNGVTLINGSVRSGRVTIGPGDAEPLAETAAAECAAASTLPDGRTNFTIDFGFYRTRPTAITLSSFSIEAGQGAAQVRWQTALESETLGFNLWRAATEDRALAQQVNSALVPADGRGAGSVYTLADANGAPGAYYWLEEVELSGKRNFHGPVRYALPQLNQTTQAGTAPLLFGSTGGVQLAQQSLTVQEAPAVVTQAQAQQVAAGGSTLVPELAQPQIAVQDETAAAPQAEPAQPVLAQREGPQAPAISEQTSAVPADAARVQPAVTVPQQQAQPAVVIGARNKVSVVRSGALDHTARKPVSQPQQDSMGAAESLPVTARNLGVLVALLALIAGAAAVLRRKRAA